MCLLDGGIDMTRVEMFHSMTSDVVKGRIRKDMENPQGQIRVMFCTNAAGMGVNYKSVQLVVSYGPPQEMDTFVQHLGRAGRDGAQSTHLLLFNGQQLRNVDSDMLLYAKKCDGCRREAMLASYKAEPDQTRAAHYCCDLCTSTCTCNQKCEGALTHPAISFQQCSDDSDEDEEGLMDISVNEREVIRCSLEALRESYHSSKGVLTDDLMHGFTEEVIDVIMEKLPKLDTVDKVLEECTLWGFNQALDVFMIISNVLQLSLPSVNTMEYIHKDD